ncbi:MAG TPA: hypothetical protein VG838_10385 [Opitutaceae bacterium]|nr:hypothetical protein [Opitutaceae bacterium]
MTIAAILLTAALFLGLIFGLGLPWVAAARFDPAEKISLGAAAGVLQIYLFAWLAYGAGASDLVFIALPVLAAGGVALRLAALRALFEDAEAKAVFRRQLLFSGWCVGWLALVQTYSGGEWSADWQEHYERALFFLEHRPLATTFLGLYSVPARPPLANLADGALMALTARDFAHFQLCNTLFSTLCWLPAAALVRHFGPKARAGGAVLLLMMMTNALVIQNATFAWTKLLAAFFILLSVVFHVRGLAEDSPGRRIIAVGAAVAALLTHYSALPYAMLLGGSQLSFAWRRRDRRAIARELAASAAVAAALAATWLGWAVLHYGAAGTFLSSTTGAPRLPPGEWILCRIWNLFITFVPHPLRPMDYSFIAQTNFLGFAHDYFFTIYQTTLPGAFGAAGVALWLWFARHQRAPAAMAAERWFWRGFIPGAILLSIATAYWRDRWGVAHIGLSPVVLIGLAWLAARWEEAPVAIRRLWAAALAVDATLGLALHFYLQHTLHASASDLPALLRGQTVEFSPVSTKNLLLKQILGYRFVGDGGPPPLLLLMLLAVTAVIAVRQVTAAPASSRPDFSSSDARV